MKTSYIDYAMSVIKERALPDVRDGLKPVHRRILYSMYEDGLTAEKQHKKSATTVGNVLGRYHPHGDASVYDALVRLAQNFSMREMLIDGHGNFGSVDGDPPAAYRYTEARMSKIAAELLSDIDKETVDFLPNFDESRMEPLVLPARFPNILVNGSSGIAVGMATNIPPHNLRETIDACVCVLDNPEAGVSELMEHMKGPDFPTRGIIMGRSGIRAAFATGRGRIIVRARTEFEEVKDRTRVIVTERPYQVNTRTLSASIADQVKEKRLEGISDLRDESGKEGMRMVIELKKDANAQVVLNRLFKQTALQSSFSVNMLALVDNQTQPKILNLRGVIDEYISFRKEVVIRRTKYELRKALERAHLIEGLLIAVDNIDEVIRIIRESYDDAKQNLMNRFGVSEVQASAILDMRLRALQGLEREKLQNEYDELQKRIEGYRALLESEELLVAKIREELIAIRDKFGSDRLTEIQDVEDEIDIEDLIDEEQCVFTLTAGGYIKRLPVTEYSAQRRGGKGIRAMAVKDEDYVKDVFTASTHDQLLFFTSLGKAYIRKGYRIPEAGRIARGTNIKNVLPLDEGEYISAMLAGSEENLEDIYLVFITRNGTAKRMRADQLKNVRQNGIRALNLDEGDELISVLETKGDNIILICTANGSMAAFSEDELRPMGRTAVGVRGIRLREGDKVIAGLVADMDQKLLTLTENGFGKRTPVAEFISDAGPRHRGSLGIRCHNITEKTGSLVSAMIITEDEDILLISDDGTIIRTAAEGVSVTGRNAMGVKVMRLSEGSRLISAAKTEKADDEEDNADAQAGAADEAQPEE
ncbi:MAG: DNA gyrase subunit A [Oscillospiraceae bacterium]|nr:DNA gyrase subunit A [Oscillospiraceae bacterium]